MILAPAARPVALVHLVLAVLLATGCGGGGGGPAGPVDGGAWPDANPDDPDAAPDQLHEPTTVENVQAGDDWNAATRAALDTLARMYDPLTGMFSSGHMWTWASGIEVSLASYEKSTGAVDHYMFPATRDLRGFADFLEEFGYDDQAWYGNAWIRAYDATGNRDYLDLAGRIFADMRAGAWDETSCGGGVWWNPNKDFKNAVTAELFILLAANLHNRTPGDTEYLEWAQRSWTWFMGIGMINEQQLINDGLRDCMNKGEPVWIYNQGIILGAAVELYRATGDEQYLTVAERLADASTTLLVDGQGVLRERCEATGDCNDDQSAFKGIYQRYLYGLYEITGKPAYREFLLRHARSIWASRNANNGFGLSWNGPIDRVDSQRQIAAANALAVLAPPFTAAVPFARAAGGVSFNHAMGHPVAPSAWACDAGSCPQSGLVQSGPFLASLRPGSHTLHALVSVSRTRSDAVGLAELEVYSANGVVASRQIKWNDFVRPGLRHDVALAFVHDPAQGPLEFRVRWLAAAGAPALTVHDLSIGAAASLTAANLDHACGRLDTLERWSTDRRHESADCTMLSGGALVVDAGPAVARFELQVDDFAHDDAPVARLAVVDHADQRVVATQTLTRHSFATVLLHGFDLPFQAEAGHAYDFTVDRLHSSFAPTLRARAIQVRPARTTTPIGLPFNVRGIRQTAGAGELDDSGSAFSAQALAAPLHAGVHDFSFGPLTDGSVNLVAASGQVVNLPAQSARAIELLAFATYGTQAATFKVDYSDGSSETFSRDISDWWATDLQADEDHGVAAAYFWKTGGRQYGNFHVFLHALPLDRSKTPSKLTLPNNPKIKVLAASAVAP